MLHMKNIHRYEPEVQFVGPATYLKDDEGRDWYLVQQKGLWQKDTIKILYDKEGNVLGISPDPTEFDPNGQSVVELDPELIPPAIFQPPYEGWVYMDGIVSKLQSQVEKEARNLRDQLLKATDTLFVPDYTIGDEFLNDEQMVELKKVRMELKTWPKTPGWPNVSLPEIPEWLMHEALVQGFYPRVWP